MTLKENIHYFKNLLKKIDQTNKYHDNLIKKAMSKAYTQVASDVAKTNPKALYSIADEYTAQTVTLNATTLEYYTLLPAPFIKLSTKNGLDMGVVEVNTNGGKDVNFVQTTRNEYADWYNSDNYLVDDTYKYIVTKDRIIYMNDPEASIRNAGVRILLVIPIEEYSDTDDVNIPDGMEKQFEQYTLDSLRGIQPVDLRNDNADIK